MERNGLNLNMAFSAIVIPILTPCRAQFASYSCKQYQIAVSDCQIESFKTHQLANDFMVRGVA